MPPHAVRKMNSSYIPKMASSPVSSILERIAAAGTAYGGGERGSRESLIDLGLQLVSALEIPSEFIQRSMWAEVSLPPTNTC